MKRSNLENVKESGAQPIAKYAQLMLDVSDDILEERTRQNDLWGVQYKDMRDWLPILGEEYGEVCQAIQANQGWSKKTDAQDLYKELIQLSAVAARMAEQLKEERGL